MNRKLLFIICFLFLSNTVFTQSIRWGEVSKADLEMTEYPGHPGVDAAILVNTGKVVMLDDISTTFTQHKRIKIFSESAFEKWGTIEAIYGNGIDISEVAAQTIWVEDGEVKKATLNRRDFFRENVVGGRNGLKQLKFTFPQLKKGVIIEYKMTRTAELYFPDWYFQSTIPTRSSELILEVTSRVAFVGIQRGMPIPLAVNDGETRKSLTGSMYNVNYQRIVKNDIPPVTEEAFGKDLHDLQNRVSFEVHQYYNGIAAVTVDRSWQKHATDFTEVELYKNLSKDIQLLKEKTNSVIANASNNEEKVKLIFDYVRDHIKVSKDLEVERGLNRAFEQAATGVTAIEQDQILIKMLRYANLEANWVRCKRREEGEIYRDSYISDNYTLLVYTKTPEGKEFILNAIDPNSHYLYLEEEFLNGEGFLLAPVGKWVKLNQRGRYIRRSMATVQLQNNGTLEGELDFLTDGYAGVESRKALRDVLNDGVKYLSDEIFADQTALLKDIRMENQEDPAKALIVKAQLKMENYAQPVGDKMYLNPIVFDRQGENPFKQDTRQGLIDMLYPREYVFASEITLPEGWVVEELPPAISFRLPLDGGEVRRTLSNEAGKLVTVLQLKLKNATYGAQLYPEIKRIFGILVTAHEDQVVLKKAN